MRPNGATSAESWLEICASNRINRVYSGAACFHLMIRPFYTPEAGSAKRSAPQAVPQERAKEKLALAIPTLREAANLPGLLRHLRSVLDPALDN